MEQILLSGYYGFNNAGDEAILAALIAGLKEEISDLKIIVLSSNPEFTEELHQVTAIDRLNLREIIYYLRQSDLLISGGGSLLQDVTSYKNIPYYLAIIWLAKLTRTPVFFCAQGVGPINAKLNQKLVAFTLNRVELITVRDQNSQQLLKSIGVQNEVKYTTDLVFNLSSAPAEEIENILLEEGINFNPLTIGISVRPWGKNDYLKELAPVVDGLIEQLDVQIVLIPLHHPADWEVSQLLQEQLNNSVKVLSGNYAPQQLIGLIANCDLMLGVRLHSLIFAAVARVPVAGISYDPKIDSFLGQLDLAPVAAIDDFNSQFVQQKLVSIWNNREEQLDQTKDKLTKLQSLAATNFKLAHQKLSD
jgi:polysaccharide pyruvyl transferase CsaB